MAEVKPAEISAILRQQLSGFSSDAKLEEVGTVLQVGDGIARAYGMENAQSGELVEFETGLRGIVLNLEEDNVGIVLLGPAEGIKEGSSDGTYVKEKTDWLIMTKMEEQNVSGGESVILHLDDWEHLDDLSNDPVGQQNFTWGSPKSKKVDYKVEHPVFSKDKDNKPTISYIDQFPEPKNMEQVLYLQKLSDALEESKNKISFPLPVGSTIFSNNYFWLHGRKAFKEHSGLSRELLRIRGIFFN